MWSPFWSSFDAGDYSASKTLAHATAADVDAGKTTWWEKKSNASADTYAKAGALQHGVEQKHADLVRGFVSLARESRRWSAELEVLLSGNFKDGRPDTVGLGREGQEPEPEPEESPEPDGNPRSAVLEGGEGSGADGGEDGWGGDDSL